MSKFQLSATDIYETRENGQRAVWPVDPYSRARMQAWYERKPYHVEEIQRSYGMLIAALLMFALAGFGILVWLRWM